MDDATFLQELSLFSLHLSDEIARYLEKERGIPWSVDSRNIILNGLIKVLASSLIAMYQHNAAQAVDLAIKQLREDLSLMLEDLLKERSH
jgi:hypothetical protein